MSKAPLTVIGIDPGSRNTGWGVVHESSGVVKLVACGVIRPLCTGAFADRLAYIFQNIAEIIEKYNPKEAAIEQVFTAKNPLTALKLGHARGTAVVACASKGLLVKDYSATTIKKAIVGHGHASKEQVSYMIKRLLGISSTKNIAADTSDALAAALCHLTTIRFEHHFAHKSITA